jgi:phage tail protein X
MLTPAVDTTIVCTGAVLDPCKIPPPPGLVAVQVVAPVGNSPSANLFTYQPLTVSEFYPPAGPTTGGLTVQIWGTSLKAGMTVHFGDLTATVSSCVGSETCVVTLPAAKSAGGVPLSVTVDGVAASPTPDQFTYVVYPTITGITPNVIPANTGATAKTVTVAITGTGFVSGSTSVIFEVLNGGALSNVACSSAGTECTATITAPTGVATIVTEPVAVTVGGYTSLGSVNLTFPMAPAKPLCKGTTCN